MDNIDDAGIDCTREQIGKLLNQLNFLKNQVPASFCDRYWDERSLDRELQEKIFRRDDQEEVDEFNKSAEIAEDPSRSFQNEVLDPYYQSGSHPSNPLGHSLDSFV